MSNPLLVTLAFVALVAINIAAPMPSARAGYVSGDVRAMSNAVLAPPQTKTAGAFPTPYPLHIEANSGDLADAIAQDDGYVGVFAHAETALSPPGNVFLGAQATAHVQLVDEPVIGFTNPYPGQFNVRFEVAVSGTIDTSFPNVPGIANFEATATVTSDGQAVAHSTLTEGAGVDAENIGGIFYLPDEIAWSTSLPTGMDSVVLGSLTLDLSANVFLPTEPSSAGVSFATVNVLHTLLVTNIKVTDDAGNPIPGVTITDSTGAPYHVNVPEPSVFGLLVSALVTMATVVGLKAVH
jgi:hypothetical protein